MSDNRSRPIHTRRLSYSVDDNDLFLQALDVRMPGDMAYNCFSTTRAKRSSTSTGKLDARRRFRIDAFTKPSRSMHRPRLGDPPRSRSHRARDQQHGALPPDLGRDCRLSRCRQWTACLVAHEHQSTRGQDGADVGRRRRKISPWRPSTTASSIDIIPKNRQTTLDMVVDLLAGIAARVFPATSSAPFRNRFR